MLIHRMLPALLPLLLLMATGCAQKRLYNVQVLNQTDAPVTVGFAKAGGPFEPHLASPEELAVGTPSSDEGLWPFVVVQPGKIGYSRVEGKFGGNASLTLRVYAGARDLSDILAIPRGSAARLDLPLDAEPARNQFVVTRDAGRLAAKPVDRIEEPQPAREP